MSWINVGDGRFRNPIPRVVKDRRGIGSVVKRNEGRTGKGQDSSFPSDFELFALSRDTIPSELHWTSQDIINMNKECNNGKDQLIEYWTRKETSCDIELDTTGKIIIKSTSQKSFKSTQAIHSQSLSPLCQTQSKSHESLKCQ